MATRPTTGESSWETMTFDRRDLQLDAWPEGERRAQV
jgi:hypothetical protein